MRVRFYNADGGLMDEILTDSPSRVIQDYPYGYARYEIVSAEDNPPAEFIPCPNCGGGMEKPEIAGTLCTRCTTPASDVPDPLADEDIFS